VVTETASTGGFFGFIKNLFTSSPAPEVKPAPSAPRGRNQNNRNGNGGGNNRNRGRRGERNDRGERPAETVVEGAEATSTPREAGSGRGRQDGRNRNGNRNQNNQNPKPENQAAVTPATESEAGTEASSSADGDERRGRGRNRRGRGRGQRGERTESNGDAAIASVVAAATSFSGPPAGMAGASATMPIQNIAQSFGNAVTTASTTSNEVRERAPREPREPREQRAPRQSNRPASSATESAPQTLAAPAIEVIAKPMPELPKIAFQALEETPLHSVVQSAGMVWVATDSSKHQEAQSQINAEPEIMPMGRTPKAPVNLQNGPMVLVETGGQEKTV
jgi:ribonuclease E